MAKIKLSPSNNETIDTAPLTVKEWFGSNFNKPNFETERSVSFDAAEVQTLAEQQDCEQLVISKHVHEGKKTLAIAGVDINGRLQDGESFVLVGNHFEFPESANSFDMDFSNLKSDASHPGSWGTPSTISQPTGSFATQMGHFQKAPYEANLFLTVNFAKNDIGKLFALNPKRIAFLPGFVYLTVSEELNSNSINLTIKSNTPIEVLIAFAIIDGSSVVVGTPIIPLAPWPYKWPPYS